MFSVFKVFFFRLFWVRGLRASVFFIGFWFLVTGLSFLEELGRFIVLGWRFMGFVEVLIVFGIGCRGCRGFGWCDF